MKPLLGAVAVTALLPVLFGLGCGGSDDVSFSRDGDSLRFATQEATAVINTQPFSLTLLDASGRELAREAPGALEYERAGRDFPAGDVAGVERDGRTLRLLVDTEGGPGNLALTWRSDRTLELLFEPPQPLPVTAFADSYRLTADEAIYGLSERVSASDERVRPDVPPSSEYQPEEAGSLNRRGEVVEEYVRPTMALYAPFYQSSAGYGLHVAGTTPGEFDVGATDNDALRFRFETGTSAESHTLHYYLFAGEPTAVVDEYTALTGRPFVPPEWAFEHWRWRDELAAGEPREVDGVEINAQVADDLLRYEEHGIPPGVYMIDRPWSPGEFGFQRFAWDEERLPNAAQMLELLAERGYRLVLWTSAWAVGDAAGENGAEAQERGYLAPGSDRIVDLTNVEAWEWWKAKHVAFARAWDVAGWKLDRGEEFIPSRRMDVWADGRSGREVHNEYPTLQARLLFEAMREARGDDFVIKTRAGYTGTQQYAIAWGGDSPGSTNFGAGKGTDLGLRDAIIQLQRAGFLGYPIWGSDTGGYYEFKDREVFARWLAFSAFTPLMEIGGIGAHAPWDMPTRPRVDEEMIEIYRRYVQLHHDLMPYTLRHARVAGETGLPIARALVFDFPDDPRVRDLWDEFMYGDDLLVAPVWRTGDRSREVYLPEGTWEDFWDGDRTFEGPATITAEAPLDRIPVFVRAGADVPGRPE